MCFRPSTKGFDGFIEVFDDFIVFFECKLGHRKSSFYSKSKLRNGRYIMLPVTIFSGNSYSTVNDLSVRNMECKESVKIACSCKKLYIR